MAHKHNRPCECGNNEFDDMEDEYGSLGDGGSYERCRCTSCGKVHYSMLPD